MVQKTNFWNPTVIYFEKSSAQAYLFSINLENSVASGCSTAACSTAACSTASCSVSCSLTACSGV